MQATGGDRTSRELTIAFVANHWLAGDAARTSCWAKRKCGWRPVVALGGFRSVAKAIAARECAERRKRS